MISIMKISKLDLSKIRDKKILVFGVHGDDWLGISGTLKVLADNNEVVGVVSSDGRMSGHEFELKGDELVNKRMEETRKYAQKLGLDKCLFWMYPDWDLVNRKNHITKKIVKLMLKERPDIVISLDPWGKYEGYEMSDTRTLAWLVMEGIKLATSPRWVQLHRLGRRMLQPEPQMWLMNPAEANGGVEIKEEIDLISFIDSFEFKFDEYVSKDEFVKNLEEKYLINGKLLNVSKAEAWRIMNYQSEWNENK